MALHRREFLHSALVAGAGLALGMGRQPQAPPAAQPGEKDAGGDTPKSLRILILGGTGFLGPACTESALARGHKVTLFNRGRTETMRKEAGRPSAVPEGVEVLYGNRDPEKHAEDWKDDPRQNPKGLEKRADNPKGLLQLEGKSWDAVIDTSAYFPRMAKASAELLAPHVKQYVFISSISVYADATKPITEDTPVGQLSDPTTEDFGKDFANYGPGKAACEAACEGAMPGRVTNIRPGFIVGPRDTSARFLYWPLRVRRGGEMLVPGAPEDPIQIIDVRDLGDWVCRCIERGTCGVFNATGPARPLFMRGFLEGTRAGAGEARDGPAVFTWADMDFLEKHGLEGGDFPLYVPPTDAQGGMHRTDCTRALAKGLTFRSLSDTTHATLAWHDSLPEATQKGVARFSLTPEREKEMLAAWKARK